MPHGLDKIIYRGASKTLRVTVVDAGGARQDLTGATAYFRVKECIDDPNPPLIDKSSAVPAEVTILNQSDPTTKGQYDVFLVPGDTTSMEPGKYYYDSWVQLSDGKRYPVIEPALFRVLRAVTEL